MLALQALCVSEAVGAAFLAELGTFLRDTQVQHDAGIEPPADESSVQFAVRLVRGAAGTLPDLDRRLQEKSAEWKIARMPPVDRNILRLGLYELLHETETPPPVILSEAADLAARFGDAASPAFVNGVLDALRREVCGAAAAAASHSGSPRDDHGPV